MQDHKLFLDFLVQSNVMTEQQYVKLSQLDLANAELSNIAENLEMPYRLIETHQKKFNRLNHIASEELNLDYDIIKQCPEKLARKHLVLPFSKTGIVINVLMKDPNNLELIGILSDQLQSTIKPFFYNAHQILRLINLNYRAKKKIMACSKQARDFLVLVKKNEGEAGLFSLTNQTSPAFNLLKVVFEDAVNVNASDIHIETASDSLKIRLRVDGVMEELDLSQYHSIATGLLNIIKLQSSMDITEVSMPQDGRLDIELDSGHVVSSRVSVLPSLEGVSCVIRLFQGIDTIPAYHAIFNDTSLYQYIELFKNKIQGMALITGPTGSGKTTTLYSTLLSIDSKTKKIITIEDPVELRLPGINQVEIKKSGNLGFSETLVACLRQDPDIILLGEIRNENTANIALRAAVTGHLVFSTLHTNSCISTISRLMNLNVSATMLADAISIVLSQRLLKRICSFCKTEESNKQLVRSCKAKYQLPESLTLYRGTGCNMCSHSGYRGRMPVIEYLLLDRKLKEYLEKNDFLLFKQHAEVALKGRFLFDLALAHCKAGITTLEELQRLEDQ